MKLSRKLPLSFALALGLLFLSGMFGIYQLNQAIGAFKNDERYIAALGYSL